MPKTMWRIEQVFLRSWKIPFYNYKTIPYHLQTFYLTYKFKNSLFLAATDAYEIQLLIKNLKMQSNSSPNDIPSKFSKTASCIVSEWLFKFFNKCMTTGEFPDSWTIAHITPIPKVHSPSSSSEYRPISVLPVLSKLFEKILYHRVYSYLIEHNLIDKRQYDFRENHSTELAITSIYDELLRNSDNKLITCSLFLDLSKAFDCCDHEILLDKLYHYGIRGVFYELFSNFLHIRMQCTKIEAFKSSYKRISCRFPQGSVISPLLFLLYINDITKASSFHTTLFADDINLHMSNSWSNVLQTTVNLELCTTDHWLRANKLSLNYNKTNFMLLTFRKHDPASFKVTIINYNISPEDNLKYLGVLDKKLSWKRHVQKVKLSHQQLVEFYPSWNIIHHHLYWKLSITH